MGRIGLALAACLAVLALSLTAEAGHGATIAGAGTGSVSCPNNQVTFLGRRHGDGAWTFWFATATGRGFHCNLAQTGQVTGSWSPDPAAPNVAACVVPRPTDPLPLGRFCLGWVPDSSGAAPVSAVPFEAGLFTIVAGTASVARA